MSPDRPLWCFGKNHLPVRVGDKLPSDVTHWCGQGDAEWTRRDGREEVAAEAVVRWDELLGDLADDD